MKLYFDSTPHIFLCGKSCEFYRNAENHGITLPTETDDNVFAPACDYSTETRTQIIELNCGGLTLTNRINLCLLFFAKNWNKRGFLYMQTGNQQPPRRSIHHPNVFLSFHTPLHNLQPYR